MSGEKVTFELMDEISSSKVDKLLSVYKQNPYHARVLYFNDKNGYETNRLVRFIRPNGDFEICIFKKTFGVSITNRIYSRETKLTSIIYKDKKFWYVNKTNGPKVRPLTMNSLHYFISNFRYTRKSVTESPVYKFIAERFGFINFLNEYSSLYTLPFTTVIQRKLYSYKDAMRYKFKCPYPIAELISKAFSSYNDIDKMKIWKEMQKVLLKPEHLNETLLGHHLFIDTCKMARTLNKKVNCAWGIKRLIQEHDAWAKEITSIVLEAEPLRELCVRNVYTEFQKFSGYKILKTNKDLLYEGMTQRHCVGTYIDKVDNGNCGIYHVEGGTLQLSYDSPKYSQNAKRLRVIQFRTHDNDPLPKEVNDRVNAKVEEFNELLIALEMSKDDKAKSFLNNLMSQPITQEAQMVNVVNFDELFEVDEAF